MSASRLHVAVEGAMQDPPIVFLHGFMGSHRDWSHAMARLDDQFCCVAVDLPGHGDSMGLEYPDDYADRGICRLLIETMDALDVSTFHLVGYSMGGRAALRFALNHGERIRKLVIESASPGLINEGDREARRIADRKWAKQLKSRPMQEFVETWYRQPLFDSLRRNEVIYREIVAHRGRNQPDELIRSLETMGVAQQASMWDELPGLEAETLFMAGELDDKYRVIARRAMDLCPRAQTAIVPGAGHNAHAENPEAFSEQIRNFIQ